MSARAFATQPGEPPSDASAIASRWVILRLRRSSIVIDATLVIYAGPNIGPGDTPAS